MQHPPPAKDWSLKEIIVGTVNTMETSTSSNSIFLISNSPIGRFHYRTKKFKCWHQMAAMIFAQIRQEDSLRDIDMALNAHAGKLYHIGIEQSPKSTLADANERRDYRIYEDFAKILMRRTRRQYAQTELAVEVDNAVYALDASTIDLTLSLFPFEIIQLLTGQQCIYVYIHIV